MDQRLGTDRREQVSTRRRVDRLALPVGVALTVSVLGVIFYFPVGSVLRAAVVSEGHLTIDPILTVLADPFYTGSAARLFTRPRSVPGALISWLGTTAASVAIVESTGAAPIAVQWEIAPYRLGLFGFTAYQAILSTAASVALGLPGAYLLARYEFPGRRTLRSLTILPFVLPSIMVVVGFFALFSRQGLLNDLLGPLGFGPVTPLFTLEMVVLAHAFYNAPLVIRLVTTAWEGIDARTVETARSCGAGPVTAFRDVVYPQLRPAVLTASLLTFVFTFMSFPIVLELGGLRLATVEVWLYSRVQSLELAEAAVLGTLETVVTLGLTYLYLRYEARQVADRSGGESLSRRPLLPSLRALGDPRRLGLVVYGLIVLLVFVGPLLAMIIESVTGPSGRFTTAYWEFLLAQQRSSAVGTTRPLPAIFNSLLFGVGTLVVAVPMGVVVAVVATRGGRGSRLAEALLSAPIAVSGIVVGLGLLETLVFGTELFGTRIVITGAIAIVLAHAVAAYPFVTRNVAPELGRLDDRLAEAARALGASRTRALLDIELPLVASGLLAGAAFAFAISIGEFDSTVLLAEGVNSYTMPVALERYIGNRSLGPSLGPATAMGCVLLAITAVSFVIIDRLGGRWEP
ncbi:MAG: ABC transporter permease [Halobacteriaceae archaeon]